ncbi:MAG: hypothetical protein M3Y07_06180 [Acidobacteriota bacterium]|nr:hypothetical protein [Acidobacteriota bacterium]
MVRTSWVPLLILSGLALSPLLQAADSGDRVSGDRVHYIGGTLAQLPGKSEGRIQTTDSDVLLFESKGAAVRVPYRDINVVEYGQRVDRRYLEAILISPLLLLSKKRTHFLTVGYQDQDGHQQAMVFQVNKSDVRSLLVSLEARTGRKIEFQDEEARKAGKG